MATAHQMTAVEWGLLIALSLLWGGTFFLAEIALEQMPPLTLVLVRVGLAALALHGLILARGERMPADLRLWAAFAAMGLLNNFIPFSLIFWSQTYIDSALAAILNATTPLWAVLAAHILTADERLTPTKLLGVLLGFAGVTVMVGFDALTGIGGHVLAQFAVVAAALSYALAGIFGCRFRSVKPLHTAAGQLTCTGVLMAPVAFIFERGWTLAMPGPPVIAAVAALALACTALAYSLYFRILASAGATNLLLVTFLIPVSAIGLGVGLLGETVTARQLAGMVLIGLGLVAIDGRLLRWR